MRNCLNLAAFLVLTLFAGALAQSGCGPAACYSGCTNSKVPVDLIFLIDVSGSMEPIIQGVQSGLSTFVTNLQNEQIIPWYYLIIFGNNYNEAVLLLNAETDFTVFIKTINGLSIDGGWEPSLETIRRAANTANSGNFGLSLRSGSTRTIILVTNEDSDPAYLNANLYQTSKGNNAHEACPPPVWSQWQAEIAATVTAFQAISASAYLLLSVDTSTRFRTAQTCLTNIQLGDFNLQSQNSDFSNFSPSGTLANLAAAGTERIEDYYYYGTSSTPLYQPYTQSLQALLLKAGIWARAFDVDLTDNSNLIANFFQAIVVDVSKCNHTCYTYPCSTPTTCAPPVLICGCDGVPYSGATYDPNGVCCTASKKDCFGNCNGNGKLDPCGVCTAGGAADANCKLDCNGGYYLTSTTPPYHLDSCGNCVAASVAEASNCVQGCNGAWTTPANAYFYDNCGYCVAPGSNTNAHKDVCGVCNGNPSVEQNQCGVCFGTTALDNCGNPVCKGLTCVENCDGSYSVTQTKGVDPCGFCVTLGTISPQCLTDCAGTYYKSGTTPPHKYDPCGICVVYTTTASPQCIQDCSGAYHLNGAGASFYDNCNTCVPYGTNPNIHKDACGVCFGNVTAEQNQCGVCFGTTAVDNCGNPVCKNYTCATQCDGAKVVNGNQTKSLDQCGFCVPLGTTSPQCLIDCAGVYYKSGTTPPHHLDHCNICVSSSISNSPNCTEDCAGNWSTEPTPAYYYDNCGACVVASANANGNKDICGVCFGNPSIEQNQCGVCFGITALDNCGNPVCKGLTCVKNCDGSYTVNQTLGLDPCGFCVPLGTISPQCLIDCNGNYYANGTTPLYHVDECGNCDPAAIVRLSSCTQDCAGVWNGTAYYDKCGQCVANNTPTYNCTQDCAGQYYLQGAQQPNNTIDSCGVCNTQANQNIEIDKCGVCTNKPVYNSTAECTPDCHGVYTLPNSANRSIIDACGDCWWPNQTQYINSLMDQCGVCHPTRDDPTWNSGIVYDSEGNACACYTPPHPCTTQSGQVVNLCIDCPIVYNCSGGGQPDSCGLCPGNSMYGKRDQCGLCCNPEGGIPCNTEVDSCGVCFGFNKQKTLNPCHICNASACHIDCHGVANGTAVVGCDGICGSNATCNYCGNGVVDSGEDCDLGNGKNTQGSGCNNCKTESSHNTTGSIIGGIVGAVAGCGFLGAAGFFAYKYAEKAGLIGKAGKNVDFSGSNNNPLYKTDVAVKSNPLYAQ